MIHLTHKVLHENHRKQIMLDDYKGNKQTRVVTWRKRLLELVSLLSVEHTESVQILGATNLKFDNVLTPLYFDGTSILPSRCEKEIFYLMYLFRLHFDIHPNIIKQNQVF